MAEQAITEVTLFGDDVVVPDVGSDVDWAVEVAVRNGRLSVQLDKPWADVQPSTQAASGPKRVARSA